MPPRAKTCKIMQIAFVFEPTALSFLSLPSPVSARTHTHTRADTLFNGSILGFAGCRLCGGTYVPLHTNDPSTLRFSSLPLYLQPPPRFCVSPRRSLFFIPPFGASLQPGAEATGRRRVFLSLYPVCGYVKNVSTIVPSSLPPPSPGPILSVFLSPSHTHPLSVCSPQSEPPTFEAPLSFIFYFILF